VSTITYRSSVAADGFASDWSTGGAGSGSTVISLAQPEVANNDKMIIDNTMGDINILPILSDYTDFFK